MGFYKNLSSQHLYFTLVDKTTGAAITSGTVSGFRTIDGGSQAAVTGTISHKGNGQWQLALSMADTNGDNIGYLFTHADAVPVSIAITTVVKIVEQGIAVGGGSDTITLAATAVQSAANIYAGRTITIPHGTGSTGQGQSRVIVAYNEATRVAKVAPPWTEQPISGSVYAILPHVGVGATDENGFLSVLVADIDAVVLNSIADYVWDEETAGHTAPNTFGGDGVFLRDNAITADKIAANAIGSDQIASSGATEIAAAVWAEVLESTHSAARLMRGFASALFGKTASASTSTPKFRDLTDTKNRIDATLDVNGNRTSVTLDLD